MTASQIFLLAIIPTASIVATGPRSMRAWHSAMQALCSSLAADCPALTDVGIAVRGVPLSATANETLHSVGASGLMSVRLEPRVWRQQERLSAWLMCVPHFRPRDLNERSKDPARPEIEIIHDCEDRWNVDEAQ